MNQVKKQKQDYWLSLAVFCLITFGLIMIYSVSKYYSLQITNEKTDKYFLIKQLQWSGVGIVVWIFSQSIDYRFWQKHYKKLFYLTFFLVLLPIIFRGESGERWIHLGFINFQPAEMAKFTLIIYLSGWFANKGEKLTEISKMFWPFVLFTALVAFLMLVQKDLGTLSVLIAIAASIFIIAGAPVYQIFASGGIASFLVWLAIKIEPYRMERFMTFLSPEKNSLGSSYHIRNALIAIGSGGIFGLGFGQSRQKYLYLPEAQTDSIFAVISEELGFVRVAIIILLFAFVAMRGYKIATTAPDTFSRLAAVGITTWITVQMLINIGAMLSLLPLTGIPLPFISYGGSSLVILLGAVGVLVNISKNRTVVLKK